MTNIWHFELTGWCLLLWNKYRNALATKATNYTVGHWIETSCSAWGMHLQLTPINYAQIFCPPWTGARAPSAPPGYAYGKSYTVNKPTTLVTESYRFNDQNCKFVALVAKVFRYLFHYIELHPACQFEINEKLSNVRHRYDTFINQSTWWRAQAPLSLYVRIFIKNCIAYHFNNNFNNNFQYHTQIDHRFRLNPRGNMCTGYGVHQGKWKF